MAPPPSEGLHPAQKLDHHVLRPEVLTGCQATITSLIIVHFNIAPSSLQQYLRVGKKALISTGLTLQQKDAIVSFAQTRFTDSKD